MKPLRDAGVELLRAQEADARGRCRECSSGHPRAGHHHHFCLTCGRVLTMEEDEAHRNASKSPKVVPELEGHDIQFCIECAPPADLDPTSTVVRYAETLYALFGQLLPAVLEAERLLRSALRVTEKERLVPSDIWPPVHSDEETLGPFSVRIDKGLRSALYPLELMPSAILEAHGIRVLAHPYIWKAISSLAVAARDDDSRGEAARHELRTFVALLVGDRKPQQRLSRGFDERLLVEFERLRDKGVTAAHAYSQLASRTGLTALNLRKRVSRERDRTKKRRLPYVERKGPAKGVRRS